MENAKCLCRYCIDEIKSRGEDIYVGPPVWDLDEDDFICAWCDEQTDELFYCLT